MLALGRRRAAVCCNLKEMLDQLRRPPPRGGDAAHQFELRKAEERAHILEGLLIALDNLDEVIKLIRASRIPTRRRGGLIERFELSESRRRRSSTCGSSA